MILSRHLQASVMAALFWPETLTKRREDVKRVASNMVWKRALLLVTRSLAVSIDARVAWFVVL